jgi:hypothetical protein
MCDQNVGVAKRLDIDKLSKDIAALAKGLEKEVKVNVSDIKSIQAELERLIKEGKSS